jgi:hypothetical protein
MVDDPRVEQIQQYRQKLGRWRKDTVAAVGSDLFWASMECSSRGSDPLQHHLRFVQQVPPNPLDGRLSRMFSKIHTLFAECENIFR